MTSASTSEDFFETMYQRAADPWSFATSPYEQDRYGAIMRALGTRRFRRAFEPGCSEGVLTERLAGICAEVEATDISSTAVARARERCRSLANVRVTHGALPGCVPGGSFDLIVLSEVGYYLSEEVLTELADRLIGRLEKGGVFLAAHWLGASPDHLLSGDQVHEVLDASPGATLNLSRASSERHKGFRMETWLRK